MKQYGFVLNGILPLLMLGMGAQLAGAGALEQTVNIDGITTTKMVEGKPYELTGNRVVFANWYYVDPGEPGWRTEHDQNAGSRVDNYMFRYHFTPSRAPVGIRLEAQKPTIMGPLFLPFRSIIQDGKLYRGWTRGGYYESTDGIHWAKKASISFEGPRSVDIYHVFIDPSAPPSERFKTVWSDTMTPEEFDAFRKKRPDDWAVRGLAVLGDQKKVWCIRGGYSPDGITWTSLADPLVVDFCDQPTTCCYDSVLHKYVMYTRYWQVGPQSRKVPVDIRNSWTDVGRRAIGRSESSDFLSFPPAKLIVEPGPFMLPSEQIYDNAYTRAPGAPDVQLMFPTIWNGSVTDTTHIAMMSSDDGKLWHWVPGGNPLIETQPFGQWNGGCVWVNPSLIELPNGDWALPYSARNVPHKYPEGEKKNETGYAIWPRGRLVALEARQHGEFTMIPLVVPGSRLKINALTLRTGWIKVGVLGKKDRSIEDCVPIVGDQFWKQVKWKNADEMGAQPNEPVTLVFELYQAKIFGIEFDK